MLAVCGLAFIYSAGRELYATYKYYRREHYKSDVFNNPPPPSFGMFMDGMFFIFHVCLDGFFWCIYFNV